MHPILETCAVAHPALTCVTGMPHDRARSRTALSISTSPQLTTYNQGRAGQDRTGEKSINQVDRDRCLDEVVSGGYLSRLSEARRGMMVT